MTWRSRSAICCPIASRALSSGATAAASSGRSLVSSAARVANRFIVAWPMTSPRFLRSPRIWFLNIPLDLNKQGSADQNGFDCVTIEIFDADLLVPSALHDARYSYGVVAVTLVQLHLQAPEK